MPELIKNYLLANNITDFSKYTLTDEGNGVFISRWEYNIEQPTITQFEISLEEAKDKKQTELETYRIERTGELLFVKNINQYRAYYAKTTPEKNLFESSKLLPDGATRSWGCYSLSIEQRDDFNERGVKLSYDVKKEVELTKEEFLNLAIHYDERKNTQYLQRDRKIKAMRALETIEEVEAFDITQVII